MHWVNKLNIFNLSTLSLSFGRRKRSTLILGYQIRSWVGQLSTWSEITMDLRRWPSYRLRIAAARKIWSWANQGHRSMCSGFKSKKDFERSLELASNTHRLLYKVLIKDGRSTVWWLALETPTLLRAVRDLDGVETKLIPSVITERWTLLVVRGNEKKSGGTSKMVNLHQTKIEDLHKSRNVTMKKCLVFFRIHGTVGC